MAKKSIASARNSKGKSVVKCIKMVKQEGSSSYSFEENIVPIDFAADYFKK